MRFTNENGKIKNKYKEIQNKIVFFSVENKNSPLSFQQQNNATQKKKYMHVKGST